MSNEKLLAAAIVQRSVDCHESAKQTEHTKPFEPFAYSDDNYTQNVWAIAIQTVLYTIRAPRGQDWGRALGCFGWTLHKTGGCRLRSFISSQPPQAEAGHFLSLTYVLYKPRQCPTNSGLFSGKKSLSTTSEWFAFLSQERVNRPWTPANADQHQGGITLGKVKTEEKGKHNTNKVYTMGSARKAICLVR